MVPISSPVKSVFTAGITVPWPEAFPKTKHSVCVGGGGGEKRSRPPPSPSQEDAFSPAAWHGFHSSEGLSGISPMKFGTADVPMTTCRVMQTPAMSNPCCETNQHQTGQHQARNTTSPALLQLLRKRGSKLQPWGDNRASVVVRAPSLADLKSWW